MLFFFIFGWRFFFFIQKLIFYRDENAAKATGQKNNTKEGKPWAGVLNYAETDVACKSTHDHTQQHGKPVAEFEKNKKAKRINYNCNDCKTKHELK